MKTSALAGTPAPSSVCRSVDTPAFRFGNQATLTARAQRPTAALVSSHVTVDRLQFTLTVTFHYLFPILTMGLALFVAWLKTVSYLGRQSHRLVPLRKTDAQRRT
jgi:hypothetical protein